MASASGSRVPDGRHDGRDGLPYAQCGRHGDAGDRRGRRRCGGCDDGNALGADYVTTYDGNEPKPEVQLLLSGNILPDAEKLLLPFKAVNLEAVDLTIIEIFPDNVLMFLQDNDIDESSYLRRSGRLVYRQKVNLDPSKDLHQWNEHAVDLGPLFRKAPGAIYRIRLGFKKEYSLYGHKEPSRTRSLSSGLPTKEDEAVWDEPNAWYWDNDIDWSEYDYSESDDPEKPSYYMESERFPYVNLMASRIGLLAKRNSGDKIWINANDILTAKPLSDVSITLYNFQLQRIASGRTDGSGQAELTASQAPYIVVGRSGKDVSYLKVNEGTQLSTSRFDVGGVNASDGIKGFVYGDRGVWRPGDTLHVALILRDRDGLLPPNHPATLEVYTPEGQFYTREVLHGVDGFYTKDLVTSPDDPTGFWNAYFKVDHQAEPPQGGLRPGRIVHPGWQPRRAGHFIQLADRPCRLRAQGLRRTDPPLFLCLLQGIRGLYLPQPGRQLQLRDLQPLPDDPGRCRLCPRRRGLAFRLRSTRHAFRDGRLLRHGRRR